MSGALPEQEVSPAELMLDVLERKLHPNVAPGGIVVGPASDAQQQAGVVSIVDAGLPRLERYQSLVWDRAQMRCIAPTLASADKIARGVQFALHMQGRIIARMESTGDKYLVHLVNIIAGPSMHFDSPETLETLIFAEMLVGTEPVS